MTAIRTFKKNENENFFRMFSDIFTFSSSLQHRWRVIFFHHLKRKELKSLVFLIPSFFFIYSVSPQRASTRRRNRSSKFLPKKQKEDHKFSSELIQKLMAADFASIRYLYCSPVASYSLSGYICLY